MCEVLTSSLFVVCFYMHVCINVQTYSRKRLFAYTQFNFMDVGTNALKEVIQNIYFTDGTYNNIIPVLPQMNNEP